MCIQTKYLYLKNHVLFTKLCEEKLNSLLAITRIVNACRGECINYGNAEFSKIYFVVKGNIKIASVNENGEEFVKDILSEGDYFGDLGLYGNYPENEHGEPLTPNTIICCIKACDFRKILQEEPAMALQYVSKVSSKLRKLEERHADLVFRDAKARLITFIKNWARTDGSRVGNKIILNNYLTHNDIAGFISTSRQSVNVLLNELRDSGMLFYNRKQIELQDAKAWN